MKLRKTLAAAGLGVAIAIAPAVTPAPSFLTAAVAVAPMPNIGADNIVDQTGLLTARQADIRAAIAQAASQTHMNIYVVFVDSFSGMTGPNWADATAEASQLGDNDLLLAVAPNDRQFGLSIANDAPLTGAQRTGLANAVQGALEEAVGRGAQGDWAAAPIALANTLANTAGQAPPPAQATPDVQPDVEEPAAAQVPQVPEQVVPQASMLVRVLRIVLPILAFAFGFALSHLWIKANYKRKMIEKRQEVWGY